MKRCIGICYLLSGIFISSCGIKKTPDSCKGAICTAEFRMLTVYLKDSSGADFIPDKVETYNSNAQLINYQTAPAMPGESVYTYIDDNDLADLGVNIENDVVFKIIKNNQVIKEQPFKVKADCCHVIKVSGADTLIVQ